MHPLLVAANEYGGGDAIYVTLVSFVSQDCFCGIVNIDLWAVVDVVSLLQELRAADPRPAI